MSIFQSAVALFYVILFILSACTFTFAAPKEITGVTTVSKEIGCYHYIMTALLLLADMDDMDGGQIKTRVKRDDDGAGRFANSARMGPMKVLQLFFTLFGNMFAVEPVGGRHPMSRSIPGSFVQLFKQTFMDKVSPNLSKDH